MILLERMMLKAIQSLSSVGDWFLFLQVEKTFLNHNLLL